jgi:hypothetical protein
MTIVFVYVCVHMRLCLYVYVCVHGPVGTGHTVRKPEWNPEYVKDRQNIRLVASVKPDYGGPS